MSSLSTVAGVFGTTDVVVAVERMSGPLPNTNTRNTFTPAMAVVVAVAGSAKPSATGRIPPILVNTVVGPAPIVSPVQPSNSPLQSAKLITIEGVPALPNALGAGNRPVVMASTPLAPSDADTAAYSTLQGPFVIATISPYRVDDPRPKLVPRTPLLDSRGFVLEALAPVQAFSEGTPLLSRGPPPGA